MFINEGQLHIFFDELHIDFLLSRYKHRTKGDDSINARKNRKFIGKYHIRYFNGKEAEKIIAYHNVSFLW